MALVIAPTYEQQSPAPPGESRLWKKVPPLLAGDDPFSPQDDGHDSDRVQYVLSLWHSQDAALRGRDRQVEENIRMLAGQHWAVYDQISGRFRDLSQYLTDEERRWRQLPAMNRLLLWFMLLHARMTEQMPVISFQPSTGDAKDATLAEAMDTVFKTLWRQTDMLAVLDHLVGWLIPGGSAFLKTRIDRNAGDWKEFSGPAAMSLLGADGAPILGEGGAPIERYIDHAPYGPDGQPRVRLVGEDEWEPTGEPHREREGALVVDVLSPLEVRGEWGIGTPWKQKGWHIHRSYLTPEQVFDTYGVEMEPEITGADAQDTGELQRLLFGDGFFGAAGGASTVRTQNVDGGAGTSTVREGFIEVFECWFRPSGFPGMEQTPDNPGGRLLVTTRTRRLRDGVRFAPFSAASPIHRFDFVKLMGRPSGTSPQEMLNGPARTRNRLLAQILEHATRVANPLKLIDRDSGIQEGQITNRPGQELYGSFATAKGPPVAFVSPPPLGSDVYKAWEMLTSEFDQLGNLEGSRGATPTPDASGELVRELRYNGDRFIGPTQRRLVLGLADVVEDWIALLPVIWDEKKILRVAGEDSVAQTIEVLPEMFRDGRVDVVPDVESMLPEGRGERIARVFRLYTMGAFGPPGTPEANRQLLENANFPHMDKALKVGGVDRVLASQENGRLVQGVSAEEIGVFEWQDHEAHVAAHEALMKGPFYGKLPLLVQEQFVAHREAHKQAMQALAQQQIAQQAGVQAQAAQAQAAVQASGAQAAMALMPQPPQMAAPAASPPGPQRAPEGGFTGMDNGGGFPL